MEIHDAANDDDGAEKRLRAEKGLKSSQSCVDRVHSLYGFIHC